MIRVLFAVLALACAGTTYAQEAPLPAKPVPPRVPDFLLSEEAQKKQAEIDERAEKEKELLFLKERVAELCKELGNCPVTTAAPASSASTATQQTQQTQQQAPQVPTCDPRNTRVHDSLREGVWGREFVRVMVTNPNPFPIHLDTPRFGTVVHDLCPGQSVTLTSSLNSWDPNETGLLLLLAKPSQMGIQMPESSMVMTEFCAPIAGRQEMVWIVEFNGDNYRNRGGLLGNRTGMRTTSVYRGSYGRGGSIFGSNRGYGYARCY